MYSLCQDGHMESTEMKSLRWTSKARRVEKVVSPRENWCTKCPMCYYWRKLLRMWPYRSPEIMYKPALVLLIRFWAFLKEMENFESKNHNKIFFIKNFFPHLYLWKIPMAAKLKANWKRARFEERKPIRVQL